jgi:photosystem II stability/assembly factor-like uncharacterized protein
MKYALLYIISIIHLTGIYAQTYWVQQSSPTTKQLYECFFTDSLYGWAIGDSGTVVHTTNSGANWSIQQTGVFSSELMDICFINRTSGWIVYIDTLYRTVILKTTNGGQNWAGSPFPDTTLLFSTIYFTDNSTGYISGFSGRIFKTTSGGAGWFECGYDTAGCFYLLAKNDIHFVNSQTGYICGGVIDFQGIILKTTDGGVKWNSLCISPEPLNEIKYYGGNNVYVIGGDYDLGSMYIRTTNLGNNWAYDTTGCFGNATGFAFRTPSEVWAALSFSTMFAVNLDSMKPGSVWQRIPAPDNTAMNDVEFATPTKGWAIGSAGRIYRYNSNVIGVGNINNATPKAYELFQNYPNPFNPVTIIKYALPNAEYVRLIVYDITGREIKILNEGIKQAGIHSVEFEAGDGLASEVYFYTLTAGSYSMSRKMVIIK